MIVAAFYRFVRLNKLEALRSRLEGLAAGLGFKGTILLAEEGINGGLCGAREALDAFMAALGEDERFVGLPVRFSAAAPDNPVFDRLKVRIKPEIVSLGQPEADPLKATGQRVAPADWNALLDSPDVPVVDVRNAYETAIGGFPGALDPDTERFRDFPAFVEQAPESGCAWRGGALLHRRHPLREGVRLPASAKALRRCISLTAASSTTWLACPRRKAAGAATASSSTNASPLTANCVKVGIVGDAVRSSRRPAQRRLAPSFCGLAQQRGLKQPVEDHGAHNPRHAHRD